MFGWHQTFWVWPAMGLFWLTLLVLIYFAVRGATRPESARAGARAAEILEQRLAHGEISTEEYNERRKALESA